MPLWWEAPSWLNIVGVSPEMQNTSFNIPIATSMVSDFSDGKVGGFLSLTWCIWYHRTRIVFSNESFNGQKLMDDAIFFCWTWLKNMEKGFDIPFHSWSSNIRAGFCIRGGIGLLFLFVVGYLVTFRSMAA